MYSFRKSKKGFTLIELMVVVAIIGVLALLGLRLYTGQQEKAKNALVKANVGTIQTLIQAELADSTPTSVNALWTAGTLLTRSKIHNPVTGSIQTTKKTTVGDAGDGDVWVAFDTSTKVFSINGDDAGTGDINVYTTDLNAQQ